MSAKSLRTKKINHLKVKTIPKENVKPEFIKGYQLFDEPYANIFILAKKNSGKTTVEFNIVKKTANKNTTVVIFAGQLYKDASYKYIVDWLKEHEIPMVLNNSLIDEEGQNQLSILLEHLRNEYKEEFENGMDTELKQEENQKIQPITSLFPEDSDSEEEDENIPNSKIKPSKQRKLAPDYIFIFDDLSTEIRNSVQIASLLKENRHYKSKVIICSQYLNDLRPDSIMNLDYILMFRKIPEKKIDEVHDKLNLDVSLQSFRTLYVNATAKQYHFLYVDIKKDLFRKDFSEEYEI